ncbi:hypothetical protein [Brevibacillus brevis]|uniref:hypothetical protein n=1 Tax=Brevibacillus brevis TaxID=1393 RepID=UPI000D0F9672|nr:hypothetical protein [Brevibacillus brevis]PSJ67022.1 hypothetical protein C7J99_21915 [Brevibacillus brevis]RED25583.1 hypothetical protein DES34_11219 [Brevibacillus brevis]GEC92515.1 hypothetical protein BBR01nite_48460 [Brevibacillus brevis]VEF87050.1 ATPase involved in DNA repair [Brevibacillus brevis]
MFTAKANDELKSLLAPIRKQLGLRVWIQQLTVYGLWGIGASLVLLLLARVWPIPFYQWIAVVLPVLVVLTGLVRALWIRPTWLQCAQVADGNGLAQRVVTAWENQENQSMVAGMQREDALQHLRKNLPHIVESVRIWSLVQRKVYVTSSLLLVCLVLFLWPNPQDLRLAQMAEEKKAVAQVEEEVEAIKQEVKKNTGLTDAQKKQLEEMLEQAKKAMAKADDPAERQNALRAAEKQLEKVRDAEQRKEKALQALQRSLGNQEGTKALAGAMEAKDRQAMTEALAQMAKAMESMPQKEREEIARELASAAEQLKKEAESADSKELEDIAKQLAEAAQQTAQGQVPQAMTALENSLMQAMTGIQQSQQAMLAAIHAAASLNQSQMTLASAGAQAGNAGASGAGAGTAATGQATPASGTPGNQPTAATPGAGANPNQGANPANQPGNGNNGSGQGNGNGNGNGNGSGNGNGNGSGGQGSGQGGGAGLGKGKHELVTVPAERIGGENGPVDTVGGPLGSGPSQSQQSGNTQVSSGGTLPYEEVYGQYEQFARESMEKGSIPGDYQQIVKDYFSKIEP